LQPSLRIAYGSDATHDGVLDPQSFSHPFSFPCPNSLVARMLSCSIPILHPRFIREEPERMAFSAIDMLFTQRIDGKRTFSQTLQFSRKSEYRIIGA